MTVLYMPCSLDCLICDCLTDVSAMSSRAVAARARNMGRSSALSLAPRFSVTYRESEFFIDDLLVPLHSIIEMVLVDRPCAMGV